MSSIYGLNVDNIKTIEDIKTVLKYMKLNMKIEDNDWDTYMEMRPLLKEKTNV